MIDIVEGLGRPRRTRRLIALAATFALALSGLLIVPAGPASAATRAFTPVFNTNTTGDVMIRGNSLMTCPAGSKSAGSTTLTCENVQNGTSNGANNNFFMSYVDTDSDATTFDSSDATVTIPAGATVLYAGLSWSGTSAAGSLANYPSLTGVAAPNALAKGTVNFKVPGGTSYTTVNSSVSPVDSTGSGYQGFKDVTTAVQAAGSGVYTVANVQAGTGGNDYAGWALAVAYRDPTQPIRNLTIFTGFTNVANGASTSIPISGFTTPFSGPVVTRMGAVVYEGDRGNIGDTMTLGTHAIANALNPVNDVENNSISDLGVAIANRTPMYPNTLSVDIDRFDATGFLTNGQTATTFNLKTVGDTYYPGLISLATDLYSPSLQATKTVKDLTNGISGTVKTGDVLAYSIAITNGGGDESESSILSDAVPAGSTYAPGSLVVDGTAVTDAAGDDVGTVTGGTVTARLGIDATGTTGGTLAAGESTTVVFNVTVNAGAVDGTIIANAATLGYKSATTGAAFIGASNTVSSTVSVINVNPVLAFAAPPSGEVSATYTTTFTAAGGTGPYTWAVTTGSLPAGLTLNATTGALSGTPTASGFSTFTVSATDANAQVATQTTSIYIAPQPVLAYPSTLQNADTNNAYSYPLGVNPGTGPYVWSVSAGSLPTGLTLHASTGVISGTPTVAATTTFTVQVVDTFGASATEVTILTVLAGPTLSNAAAPSGERTVPYSYGLNVVGGTAPYIWTSTGSLPPAITLASDTGLLSGTPSTAGTFNFTVIVTDVNGANASQAMTITIILAPTLGATLAAGEVTAPYSSGFTVSNGTGPFAWSVRTGSLPTGLTINSATGVITGTPTVAGAYPVTIQAVDANGATATRPQTMTVSAGPTVVFTPPNGEVGVAYTAQPTVSGGTGPYAWAVSAGTLPAGLSINPSTGAITGTPSAAGTTSVTVQATDAKGGNASQGGAITIVPAPTLTGTLAGGEVSAPYTSGFTVNDGTGPFVWTVITGTLPAGLSINTSTGLIAGTPTATGSSAITVRVTDANNLTTTRSGTITVTAGPAVTFAPPDGAVGISYTAQPTASGGTGPYTWAVSAGTLPAGLSINPSTGAITGTPTVAGTAAFTVKVTDSIGGFGTQAVSVLIKAAASLASSASTGSTQFGTAVTLTATVTPSDATGTVTFTDVPTTGPQAGSTVTLGTVTVTAGVATLTVALPAFGANPVTAAYGGDGTHAAATATPVSVEVTGYAGEIIVTQFRTSGPGGANDAYTELYNTGPPVPLAGFIVASGTSSTTLPSNAGTLGTNRSYLLTGAAYSLGAIGASNDPVAALGVGGIKVVAPDTAGTVTDTVGPAGGFHQGVGLPAMTGTPTEQHAWVRAEIGGRPVHSGNSTADFRLVSSTGGSVGGVQSTLGSASPTGTANPYQHNATLWSTLLDGGAGQGVAPNRVYTPGLTGTPGTLVVRRTITNNSGVTITSAKVRITAISQANGDPLPGVSSQPARIALLRVVNPATSTSTVLIGGNPHTVQNLGVDPPISGLPGGGLNSTLTVPLGGGLAPGASVDVAFTFAVDTGGTFWFGYDVDAS